MTLTELRRRLPVGTEFLGEFIGANRRIFLSRFPAATPSFHRRVEIQNKKTMTCIVLDGPYKGEAIDLNWKHTVAAYDSAGAIILVDETGDAFLKITLPPS